MKRFIEEALGTYSADRAEKQRKTSQIGSLHALICRPGMGFCETCQKHKPAPKVRGKGWKCSDCNPRTLQLQPRNFV